MENQGLSDSLNDARTLRLVWPQWQGAGADNAAALVPEVRRERARRGYQVGSRVLEAVLPEHSGPTEFVPVAEGDPDEGSTGGIESRSAILASLRAGLDALSRNDYDRVLTLGGECAVSVASFAQLAHKYGDDLAIVWIVCFVNFLPAKRARKNLPLQQQYPPKERGAEPGSVGLINMGIQPIS